MLGRSSSWRQASADRSDNDGPGVSTTLFTIVGDQAKLEGKFEITESIEIECEVGGHLKVSGKLVIGEKGVVRADVETVDAVIQGQYEGNMVATGNVEITATGRVSGNIETDSLLISKGGFFNGNVVKMKEREKAQQDETRTSTKARASWVKAALEESDQAYD
ncbi:MAG: polymer-forming cytoskeletal protein [Candidatus Methylomirabilia bacterium]